MLGVSTIWKDLASLFLSSTEISKYFINLSEATRNTQVFFPPIFHPGRVPRLHERDEKAWSA